MYHVYVLKSVSTGNRYIGQTASLEKRISRHNYGGSQFTKNKGPWELAYSESFETRADAMKREKFLKSGQGREFLDSLGQ